MKKMIIALQQSILSIFLNKKTSQDIHDKKNEYTAATLRGKHSANKAKKQIESTESYKTGARHNESILTDYERVVLGK